VFQPGLPGISVVAASVESDSVSSLWTEAQYFTPNCLWKAAGSKSGSDDERGHYLATLTRQKVVGSTCCLSVHGLNPYASAVQRSEPLGARKSDSFSASKQHQFTFQGSQRLKVLFSKIFEINALPGPAYPLAAHHQAGMVLLPVDLHPAGSVTSNGGTSNRIGNELHGDF
jgi:hypothetical protein